jgi:hypothetical protein
MTNEVKLKVDVSPKPELIKYGHIKSGAQMRAGLNQDTVNEYAQQMADGVEFPPCIVFNDGDKFSGYWLADGFHRMEAWRRYRRSIDELPETLLCEVRRGTERDAVLYAAQANATHGLRRTNPDKRRAVETLLRDEEWGKWSDREIARHCQVSPTFVGKVRNELSVHGGQIEDRKVKRGDTEYEMKTDKIGSSKPDYKSIRQLETGVREYVREGLSFDEEVSVQTKLEALEEIRALRAEHPFWSELIDRVPGPWRSHDLVAAIGNVMEQMRQQSDPAAQLPPNCELRELPDGLWIVCSDAFRLATDAWGETAEAIEAYNGGMATGNMYKHWHAIQVLRTNPLGHFVFIDALEYATTDQLELALMNLPKEGNSERNDMLTNRLIELANVDAEDGPDATPNAPAAETLEEHLDEKVIRLVELRSLYMKVLDTLPECSQLTGRHTHVLPARRGLIQLIDDINAELRTDEEREVEAAFGENTGDLVVEAGEAIRADHDEILAPA